MLLNILVITVLEGIVLTIRIMDTRLGKGFLLNGLLKVECIGVLDIVLGRVLVDFDALPLIPVHFDDGPAGNLVSVNSIHHDSGVEVLMLQNKSNPLKM